MPIWEIVNARMQMPMGSDEQPGPVVPGSGVRNSDVGVDLHRAIDLHNRGRLPEALQLYQQVLARDSGNFDAIHLTGVAALQLGKLGLAERLITAAVAVKPDSAEALNNLGSVLSEANRLEEALQRYLEALAHRPDYPEAYSNLGNVLLKLERLDDAEQCFLAALRLNRNFVPAHGGLGRVQYKRSDLPAAEVHFAQGHALDPNDRDILCNLALLRIERGTPEEALPFLTSVLARSADYQPAIDLREMVGARTQKDVSERDARFFAGEIDVAETMVREELARDNSLENHNFLLKCYLASPRHTARDYFDESRDWAIRNAREDLLPSATDFRNDRDPDRRLRVGIVGDYFDSTIGTYTLYPFFRHYDRSRLEITCYNFGGGEAAIRPVVDRYRGVRGSSQEAFFDQVQADAIDVMLDINGRLRTPNFFAAMLRQPAPVQVNWYNLTATVGAKAYNYLLADGYSVRPEDEELYVEKVFRMPDGTISSWDLGAPPRVPGPALDRHGAPTFGCFADFFKVNEDVLAAWVALLRRVPGSRLYLKSNNLRLEAQRRRVAEYFQAHGIGRDRLLIEGPSPYAIMKRLYELVDVALDTFPYSSGSTSINALWQGVPVIAISGVSWRERNTASILAGAGLQRFIASDVEDYIAKAEALARDRAELARLRAGLGDLLIASPQWQVREFALNFESRLRAMWQDWLRTAT